MSGRTYLREAAWANGDTVVIEPTWYRNGWYYRPDSARVKTNAKTFGRSTEGREAAKDWHAFETTKALRRQNWRMPVALTTQRRHPATGNLSVNYWLEPIGWVSFALGIGTNGRYSDYQHWTEATFDCHPIVSDIALRRVENPWAEDWHASVTRQHATGTDLEKAITDWMADPAATLDPILDQVQRRNDPDLFLQKDSEARRRFKTLLKIPDLTALPYKKGEESKLERGEVKIETWADRSTLLRLKGEVDAVVLSNETRRALDDLSAALKYFDVDFRVTTTYRDGHYDAVGGFHIRVPAIPGVEGREESHEISVRVNSTTVECGYMKDAERQLEYQKRQAIEYFNQMDEFVEITFDEEGEE